MSLSPNPHTNLLNVFIQIANNKGILYIKKSSGLHHSHATIRKRLVNIVSFFKFKGVCSCWSKGNVEEVYFKSISEEKSILLLFQVQGFRLTQHWFEYFIQ
jgi:hypothetical protein